MTTTTHDDSGAREGANREEQPEDAEDVRRNAAIVDGQRRHHRPAPDGTGINPTRGQGTSPRPGGRGTSSGDPDVGGSR